MTQKLALGPAYFTMEAREHRNSFCRTRIIESFFGVNAVKVIRNPSKKIFKIKPPFTGKRKLLFSSQATIYPLRLDLHISDTAT